MSNLKKQNIQESFFLDTVLDVIYSQKLQEVIIYKGNISLAHKNIIIATANSNRHAKSISEKLVDLLKNEKIHIIGVEGEVESGWILVDCGSIVINIMKKEHREFYDLEGLWGEMNLTDALS